MDRVNRKCDRCKHLLWVKVVAVELGVVEVGSGTCGGCGKDTLDVQRAAVDATLLAAEALNPRPSMQMTAFPLDTFLSERYPFCLEYVEWFH